MSWYITVSFMVSPFSICIKISLVKSTKLSSLRLFNQSVAPGLILMVHRSFRWWPSAPIIHRKQHYLLRSSDQSQARRQEWSPNVINLYILSVCVCTVSVRNRNIMSAGRYNSVVLFVLRLTSYIVEPAISLSQVLASRQFFRTFVCVYVARTPWPLCFLNPATLRKFWL